MGHHFEPQAASCGHTDLAARRASCPDHIAMRDQPFGCVPEGRREVHEALGRLVEGVEPLRAQSRDDGFWRRRIAGPRDQAPAGAQRDAARGVPGGLSQGRCGGGAHPDAVASRQSDQRAGQRRVALPGFEALVERVPAEQRRDRRIAAHQRFDGGVLRHHQQCPGRDERDAVRPLLVERRLRSVFGAR